MKYWLIKSEPNTWSWADQKKEGTTYWDGVRNYQANNYMKEMSVGDYALFYHSVSEKAIVGIVSISKAYYPDPVDSRFGMVDVTYHKDFKIPVTLKSIKETPELQDIPLIRQARLSVMPISKPYWHKLCEMGGVED